MRTRSRTKRCEWTSRILFITLRPQATSSKVFVLPPWKAIYVNDAERDHTFEHAESVNKTAQEWYCRCGYQVLEVPMVSVDERCTFVLRALANSDA